MTPDPRRRRRAADPPRPRHEPHGARLRGRPRAAPARRRSTLAARKHPDLVVLDLGLPGIDGVEVIAWPARLDARADHRPLASANGRPTRSPRSTPAPTTTSPSRSAWTSSSPGSGRRCDEPLPPPRRRPSWRRPTSPSTSPPSVSCADGDEVKLTPTEWQHRRGARPQRGQARRASASCSRRSGDLQYERETNYLRVYFAQIRRKLEPDPARPRYFITEPRMGYRFVNGA